MSIRDQNETSPLHTEELKVLLVDDHVLVGEATRAALRAETNFEVSLAADVGSAIDMIQQGKKYEAVLLDYEVPGMDGLKGLERILEANGGGVVLFSGVVGFRGVERAMSHGASGFIPKTLPLRVLGHAIRLIAAGETYLPADWLRWAGKNEGEAFGLRPRETQVLALLCEGYQNKEIARELGMTEVVVKMDVKAICRKLGVGNRTQAVITAYKNDILQTHATHRSRG